jgi:hypothetical protein
MHKSAPLLENLATLGLMQTVRNVGQNDPARHQNDSERVKTLALRIYQESVKQHLSMREEPT